MKEKSKSRWRWLVYVGLTVVLLCGGVMVALLDASGGAWLLRSVAPPDGWPETTPIGVVQVQEYPVHRAAVVSDGRVGGAGEAPMFMQLFRHIQANQVAMTAPVEMRYAEADQSPSATSMAFYYRSTEVGAPGEFGSVRVRDVAPQLFASLGVRGGYNAENYRRGLRTLERWLDERAEDWVATGTARFLGYNAPFVPTFMRYGEVQIPVAPRRAAEPPDPK